MVDRQQLQPRQRDYQLEMWQAIFRSEADRSGTRVGGRSRHEYDRVYLHDLLWQQDAEGFKRRLVSF